MKLFFFIKEIITKLNFKPER